MMKNAVLFYALLFVSGGLLAQIPTNDDKDFEYHGEKSVRKAGSGDLLKRFEHWGNTYFEDAVSVNVAVDDSTERYIEIDVTESMVESHFGVNKMHTDRQLSYHIKFDSERKDYEYWISDFVYKATEVGRKGEETPLDGKLSELKTAASKSLEEEIHLNMEKLIANFSEAAETELEE